MIKIQLAMSILVKYIMCFVYQGRSFTLSLTPEMISEIKKFQSYLRYMLIYYVSSYIISQVQANISQRSKKTCHCLFSSSFCMHYLVCLVGLNFYIKMSLHKIFSPHNLPCLLSLLGIHRYGSPENNKNELNKHLAEHKP